MVTLTSGLTSGFRQAMTLLTILPFPALRKGKVSEPGGEPLPDLPRSGLAYFPVVGALIGVLILFPEILFSTFRASLFDANLLDANLDASLKGPTGAPVLALLRAVLAVLIWEGIAGFLHLDGVADTADAFLSRRRGPEALAIMRDSRIGAMGASSMIFTILLKVASTAVILAGYAGIPIGSLMLAPVSGRYAVLIVMALYPYADSKKGLGSTLAGGPSRRQFLVASGFTILIAGSVAWLSATAFPERLAVLFFATLLAAVAAGIASGLILGERATKLLGGITGDVCGASIELAEIIYLISIIWVGGIL